MERLQYVLRLPGVQTKAVVIEATSLVEAKRILGIPAATGNAVYKEIVEQLIARGIAERAVLQPKEHA